MILLEYGMWYVPMNGESPDRLCVLFHFGWIIEFLSFGYMNTIRLMKVDKMSDVCRQQAIGFHFFGLLFGFVPLVYLSCPQKYGLVNGNEIENERTLIIIWIGTLNSYTMVHWIASKRYLRFEHSFPCSFVSLSIGGGGRISEDRTRSLKDQFICWNCGNEKKR